MKTPFRTIRARLLLLSFVVIAPAALLNLMTGWQDRSHELREDEETALDHARQVSDDLVRLAAETRHLLAGLRGAAEFGDASACSTLFERTLAEMPRYRNLGAVGRSGVLCAARPLMPEASTGGRAAVRSAAGGGFAVRARLPLVHERVGR